jgi:uncharacterized membrane protein
MQQTRTGPYRLQYIDWLRGLAAIIMLQGHVFHSFLQPGLREGAPYVFSQFVGGMPPAIFLFLTGVTLAFLMDSTERKGLSPLWRIWTAVRRAGYLFALAFAFRLQLWVFGWGQPWQDLLRVDILNCMGLAILALSTMAVFRTVDRIRLCAALGLGIAFAAPVISQMDWSGVPAVIRSYIVPDYNSFGFFPWAAFLAFGVSAGSIIRIMPADTIDRAMQWCAIVGGGIIMASWYFANLPYSLYTKSEYWLNSPAQILGKLGITLVALALAFVWTRYAAKDGWSWVRQFGTTSLLVYWVHIELVYGRWLYFWKNNLTVSQTVAASIGVILLMLAISTIKTNRERIGSILSDMRWTWRPQPDRVSGD